MATGIHASMKNEKKDDTNRYNMVGRVDDSSFWLDELPHIYTFHDAVDSSISDDCISP